MKKNLKSTLKYGFMAFTMAFFVTSCGTDDGSVFDTVPGDDDETVATLIINEADSSSNTTSAKASGKVGTSVPGRIVYTSDATTQKRLYITQNISGQGDMPFNTFELESSDLKKATKADGSIDLDGATKKEIDFTFDLPVPDIDNGEIVYTFWTTTGKGDFRDITKRLALGAGTITVTVGNGTNPAAEVRSITNVKLYAPAADGTTESFFSLLDEKVYKINAGPEFRAFWDFGYYYKDNTASLASTATYDDSFGFPVEGLKPGTDEDDAANETLNHTYFNTTNRDVTVFESLKFSGDLDIIVKSNSESIPGLAAGNVIEFVDNYGKKGLILIKEIKGTYNNNDYIVFDVKIQP